MDLKRFPNDGSKRFLDNSPNSSLMMLLKRFIDDGTKEVP